MMCPSKSFPVFNCPPSSLPPLIADNKHRVFLQLSCSCQPFLFSIVQYDRMLDEVWFSTERHSPTCVSHSHCTGFDKLCKHCVTKHHFRDTLTCTLTLREGGSPIFLPVKVISHCNVVHVYD